MSGNGDFVGQGWAFPVHIGTRGGIALSGARQDLDGALRMILETAPGERVMRPEFGCRIWDYMFDSTDANTLGLMAQAVRDAVAQWEPRVDVEDVSVRADPQSPTRVLIELTYRVKPANDRRNLVHPFYVIPREE